MLKKKKRKIKRKKKDRKNGRKVIKKIGGKRVRKVRKITKKKTNPDKNIRVENGNTGKILTKYFNHIYVINLDRDVKRLKRMEKIFEKLGIKFERFRAINGKDRVSEYKTLLKKKWNPWERTMNRSVKIRRPTVYGCLLSHREIVKDALRKNYRRILIFEDDVIPNKNIGRLLIKNGRLLRGKWKLIYLGSTQHDWINVDVLKNYYYANGTDGCYAYGMDRSAYREFLRLTQRPKYPVDYYMRYFQEKYRCPVLFPQAFIAKLDESRLRRKRNIRIFSKQFRWNLKNFDV